MPVNRKRHAVDTATSERWELLGRLFRARRIELGYMFRPAFAEARLPRTPQGNLSVRLLNAIENNERPGTYAPGRLEQFARAYEVTAESVFAVLDGKADALVPAVVVARSLPPAPDSGLLRESAVRPYATAIWERLLDLARRGVAAPSGAQLGLSPGDAGVWDGAAGAMSDPDRAWLVGEIQRGRDARNAGSRADTG